MREWHGSRLAARLDRRSGGLTCSIMRANGMPRRSPTNQPTCWGCAIRYDAQRGFELVDPEGAGGEEAGPAAAVEGSTRISSSRVSTLLLGRSSFGGVRDVERLGVAPLRRQSRRTRRGAPRGPWPRSSAGC